MTISHFIKTKLSYIAGVLLLAVVVSYAAFRSKDIVMGVHMSVAGITNGQKFTDNFVTLSGMAENATALVVNNRLIPVDQKGFFQEQIILLPGYNTVTLSAHDKFGKATEKNYVLYMEKGVSALGMTAHAGVTTGEQNGTNSKTDSVDKKL